MRRAMHEGFKKGGERVVFTHPTHPAGERVDIDEEGNIVGLF